VLCCTVLRSSEFESGLVTSHPALRRAAPKMANLDAIGSGSQAPDDDDDIDQEFISTLPISKSMSRAYYLLQNVSIDINHNTLFN
jgi:hypothetical protein